MLSLCAMFGNPLQLGFTNLSCRIGICLLSICVCNLQIEVFFTIVAERKYSIRIRIGMQRVLHIRENNETVSKYYAKKFYCMQFFELSYNVLGMTQNSTDNQVNNIIQCAWDLAGGDTGANVILSGVAWQLAVFGTFWVSKVAFGNDRSD